MRQYDEYYPKQNSSVRVCASCNREYAQWSAAQDSEPWSKCFPCSQPKKRKQDGNRERREDR